MNKIAIIRVSILPFGMVNCHLLVGEGGCILVDAGLPGSAKKIGAALAKAGRGFKDIKLIVVTHAHVDHAGAAAELRQLSGAPILAHADDLDYYERRKRMTYCVTSAAARLFLCARVPLQPYTAFTPDILMRDGGSFDLAPYGIEGVARQVARLPRLHARLAHRAQGRGKSCRRQEYQHALAPSFSGDGQG